MNQPKLWRMWTDELTGYEMAFQLNNINCWWAYIGVKSGHPWWRREKEWEGFNDIVPGGVACADSHLPLGKSDPLDGVWWIGFVEPLSSTLGQLGKNQLDSGNGYRTLGQMITQLAQFAITAMIAEAKASETAIQEPILSGSLPYVQVCGEVVVRSEPCYFCVLKKGHAGDHCVKGECARHGTYIGWLFERPRCPHWPTCDIHRV
ncbi:MAG: hypothetical protein KGL39_13745 [Patescibacteria group bacterium]|nr:hypothetical protein [Patescibacteria group bacterium]